MVETTRKYNLAHAKYVLVVGFISFAMSCSNFVRIPESEYNKTDSEVGGSWRVKTSERVYWVSRFTVTDTTLIIEEASKMERIGWGGRYVKNLGLPIVLSLDDLTSLELVEFSRVRTAVAITVTIGAAAFASYAYLGIRALAGAD